jgi:flagellar assembly protein FliH
MGLIKSTNAPASLTAFSMCDIEAQARIIVVRAQQQADQITAESHLEGARIRQRAYDEGFAAGTQDGLKKGTEDGRVAGKQAALVEHRAKLEQLVKSLSATINELETQRGKLESSAASEVIKLAVSIARRVTKLQGSLDVNVMTENVREAMKFAVHCADIRIVVHPSQKQALADVLTDLRMQWPNVKHVELQEDSELSVGGCRIFTANGAIDAHLETQIDRVAADLLPNSQGAAT